MNTRLLVAADFVTLCEFLAPYRASSMFLLGNARAAGLDYRGAVYQGEYLGAFSEAGALCGLLVHYWNGNLMVQAPDHTTLHALLVRGKKDFSRHIAGVLGPDDQAVAVIDYYGLSATSFAINSAEALYELALEKVEFSSSPSDYQCVPAGAVRETLLLRWVRAYEIEALGAAGNAALDERVKARVDALRREDCWVLLYQGVPVSLCGINAKVEDSVQCGPVWTPPEERNKGYARMLVRLVLLHLKQLGIVTAYLFTKDPAAMRVYEAVGFKQVGTYRLALR